MKEIRYSEDFYVNAFPNKGEEYAKKHIEAFMRKLPNNLATYLENQNNFGQTEPEFQAVIIGEPKISMFGKSQVAVVMVHSAFIAYTTASDYGSLVNRTYGYATFDNEVSVEKAYDHLEMHFAYETLAIGVGTESLEEDFGVLTAIVKENREAVQVYSEQLESEEDENHIPAEESTQVLDETADLTEEEDAISDDTEGPAEIEEALFEEEVIIFPVTVDEDTDDEERLVIDEPTEEEPIEVEEADQEDLVNEETFPEVDEETLDEPYEARFDEEDTKPMQKNEAQDLDEREDSIEEDVFDEPDLESEEDFHFVPFNERKGTVKPNVLDARFDAESMIISNNTIPRGFVYTRPVVYAHSLRPGIFRSTTPREGYINAYNKCLDSIRNDIREGKFDAVFNVQFTAQSVENYYEVVLTGDAVYFAKE